MNQQPILIRNGHLLTMDDRLGEMPCADILIEQGRIRAIEHHIDADHAQVIDASDCIVLPGFVDTHRHMWQCGQYRYGDGAREYCQAARTPATRRHGTADSAPHIL